MTAEIINFPAAPALVDVDEIEFLFTEDRDGNYALMAAHWPTATIWTFCPDGGTAGWTCAFRDTDAARDHYADLTVEEQHHFGKIGLAASRWYRRQLARN
jgi:hypothetical protein